MPQNGEWEDIANVDSAEGNNSPKSRQKNRPTLRSAVSEIMRLQPEPGYVEPESERCIGGVRNKEIALPVANEMHLCNEKWDSGNMIYHKPRSLQLHFLNKLSLPVLTGTKIEGEEHESIRIALFDVFTGQVVHCGPEASAKVEIVVLEKDVNGYEEDNWSLEEFNSKVVKERGGGKSILAGDVYLSLKEGTGSIGNVCFRHTKCWMKRREFRLGARIVDGSYGVRVREAKTEPFIVEDRRGKLYQKNHPPSLSDAVWRLERISKEGAFHERLSKEKINSVKDFVTLLNLNPQRLKDILGMPAKIWEITVDHAQKCVLDNKAYLYCSPTSQQKTKTAVVFNVVGQLLGLLVEQQFISVDKLSGNEKADAHNLVVSAFQHWGQVVPIDAGEPLMAGSQQLANVLCPSSTNVSNFETSDVFDLYEDARQDNYSFDVTSIGDTHTLDDWRFGNMDNIINNPFCFQGETINSSIYDQESVRQDINDEHRNFLFWNNGEEVVHAESRGLQLRFLNDISSPVFIGVPIEGEGCTALQIALCDGIGQVVHSGPASSAKVEIIVLDGASDGDVENGMSEEFKTNIIGEREQKKLLLAGDTSLDLKEGIGMVGEIFLTEDSSGTRSNRFRLEARVVNGDGITVRVAKTEPFTVRDQHRDSYKKHHPPSLTDEVWRLEEIWKDGVFHRRLSSENVNSVKDFLILLTIDPSRLQSILGTSLSVDAWETIVDHAQTCTLNQSLFLYCSPGSLQKTGVVFNVVGQVRGIISDSQYIRIDQLAASEKVESHKLVTSAFYNWEDVVPIDDEASLVNGSLCRPNIPCPSNPVITENSDGNDILISHNIHESDNPQLGASSHDIVPSIYSSWDVNGLGYYDSRGIDDITCRYEQTLTFTSPVTSSGICDTESMIQAFCDDEHLQISDNHCSLQSHDANGDSVPAVNDILLDGCSAITTYKARRRQLSKQNAQRRWKMIFSLMRWFSVRRNVARKTLLEVMHKDHNAYSQANVHCAVNDILSAHSAAFATNKAQRRYLPKRDEARKRWKVLFSLMRWFSVNRNVVRKTPSREIPIYNPPSGDVLPSIKSVGGIKGFNDVGLQSLGDLDHNAVDDILLAHSTAFSMNKTQRRYLSKTNKAQRRWRMLFSVVRWFSVRRNVARRRHVIDMPRQC